MSMCGIALSFWGGCRGTTDSSAESTPVSADSEDRINEKAIDIIAFGDFGKPNRMMTQTMDTYHSSFANPTMVFLLGDNSYNFDWEMTKTSQYTVYFDQVARKSSSPHYVILGNHDYELNVAGLMLKEMPSADSRWILPSSYYFKRFKRADFVLCVWFLDTEKFTIEQSTWFEKSLIGGKSTCTWTFVNGHHPGMIQASGAQYGSNFLSKYLEPILERHNVDVYLCGHHHNSQHLTNKPAKTNIFVVGQISMSHPYTGITTKGQAVWGTGEEPAFLQLQVSASEVLYSFISGRSGQSLHSGRI